MTSEPFVPLTELERDALAELSNIAMARAANSLRQMIQNEVLLAVPSVDILTSAAATKLVAKPDNPKLVAVRQDFARCVLRPGVADLSGKNSLELVRAVVGRQLALDDIVDLQDGDTACNQHHERPSDRRRALEAYSASRNGGTT